VSSQINNLNSTPPVIVVGAGALGRIFSAALAVAGERVGLVATDSSAAILRAAGSISTERLLRFAVPLREDGFAPGEVTLLRPEQVTQADGILFATKGHHLSEAAQSVASVRADWVAGVQNGVAKDDLLADVFGADRVLGAATTLGGERDADGTVIVSTLGMTYLGELNGRVTARASHLCERIGRAGIPVELARDVRSVEWSKLVNAAASFGVSILTRATWSETLEDAEISRAFVILAREVGAIADREGVALGDYVGFPALTYVTESEESIVALRAERVHRLRAEGKEVLGRRTSMLQDLLKDRPIEAESIFGDLVARAERHSIPVPALEFVCHLARGIDPARRRKPIEEPDAVK
jgi:2-dehydropantoate 2-reductase